MLILLKINNFIENHKVLTFVIVFTGILAAWSFMQSEWHSDHQKKLARECPKFITEECKEHCFTYGVLDTEVNTKCVMETK